MTLTELYACCKRQIEIGNGDKTVLISCDDEGNGYHTLFYDFNDDLESIREARDFCGFHDNQNPEDVILLG